MSIQVVEIRLSDLEPFSVPALTEGRFIYEHLRYYCSKFRPLPAIAVRLEGDRLRIVDRHIYAAIARDLGDERIRAVLMGLTFEELKERDFPNLPNLVSKETLDFELQEKLVSMWHVFYFGAGLSSKLVTEIDYRLRFFLKQSLYPIIGNRLDSEVVSHFDQAESRLEIRFPTPLENHAWATSYLELITSVSRELVPIASYQGQRFETVGQ